MKASEEDDCPECTIGRMRLEPVKNCSCHISPPCSARVENPLVCDNCGRVQEIEQEHPQSNAAPAPKWDWSLRPFSEFKIGDGKRLFDCRYDSSSGSTMGFTGRYEGAVTREEIIAAIGDGTFGHRGPSMAHGHFTYTKITD